jgi:holo-[acyl-carrier protein] synthase
MIVGIGTDVVAIDRIKSVLAEHGERFIERVFATEERITRDDDVAAHYAKRWAAKEATAKALGLGIDQGVYLRDIVVVKGENGAPTLHLRHGAAAALAARAGDQVHIHLSLSDDAGLALAFVVIEQV